MDKRYQYECWLDLHQTEFQNSEFNCEMCFPIPKQTSESIERVNISWGKSIINEWIKLGYKPKPEPIPLGSGLPDSFVESWGPLNRRMNIINTEVKNNAPDASAEFQLKVQAIAIMKSIERIIG